MCSRNVCEEVSTVTTGEPVPWSTGETRFANGWFQKGNSKCDYSNVTTLQIRNLTGRCRQWSIRHERERFIHNLLVEQQKTNDSEGCSSEDSQRRRHSYLGKRALGQKRVLVVIPFGRNALDQWSPAGYFSQRFPDFAIDYWTSLSKLRGAWCEERSSFWGWSSKISFRRRSDWQRIQQDGCAPEKSLWAGERKESNGWTHVTCSWRGTKKLSQLGLNNRRMQNFSDLGETVGTIIKALSKETSFRPANKNVILGDDAPHAKKSGSVSTLIARVSRVAINKVGRDVKVAITVTGQGGVLLAWAVPIVTRAACLESNRMRRRAPRGMRELAQRIASAHIARLCCYRKMLHQGMPVIGDRTRQDHTWF